MSIFNITKSISSDNRLQRIWYLRKLYFHVLKNEIGKLGFVNAARTQFPLKFADSKVPPAITLEFTNLCNLKCTYCTSPLKERPVGLMSEETFNRIIEDIKKFKIPRVRIVGNGEPTIHPKLKEFLSALAKVTPVVQLTSNGNFINDSIHKSIVDAGINQINISVDGNSKEIYEFYRPGSKFELLLNSLTSLKKYRDQQKSKLFINIRVMISPSELVMKKEIIKFWEQYADVVSTQYIIDITEEVTTGTFDTNNKHDRFPSCSLPFKILDIHWNGNVPLCSYSIKQSGLKEGVLLGNINKTNLLELWNSQLITQYRKAHRNRDCKNMPLCNNCFGT